MIPNLTNRQPLLSPRYRRRSIIMLDADSRDFAMALQRKFPSIRFLEKNYWEERWFSSVQGEVYQHPPSLRIPYLPDLVSTQGSAMAWIEPSSWQPRWSPFPRSRDKQGHVLHGLANLPECSFEYSPDRFGPPKHDDLKYGQISVPFELGNRVQTRFVNQVWRLLGALTTNRYDIVFDDTGRRRLTNDQTAVWTGKHALAWCAAKPQRRLWQSCRPIGAPLAEPIPRKYWRAENCENPAAASDFRG